ncbi:FAD-dependent monooxygenase [Kribbella kalugense]|uniref:2-polyprenyl-6-methoxyphenol hydroxylase-like FAD-dependent oxidoreductase n=1 Tax=Kribbella kalugense TaxID=2512221 RepID=A0A4R7ZER2_9ACTN|nr:FAD-dependent monooxygenase [Kribbella kalugense]TDW15762.1 2-polyprenyl-6-methoxyphenol hydroxylase-like FAD-dependent oxidoreductase [Kribbella kalugense]
MDVVIAGAGPTGLMLAYELALAGVDVTVVERLDARIEQVKGGALQARTAEVLELRGLLGPIEARELPREPVGGHFAGLPVPLDATPWNSRHPYPISVPQWIVEEELERAAVARGARVVWGAEVTAIAQDDEGVTVTAGGTTLRAKYFVACDGGHSTVRKLLDAPFPGRPGTFRAVLTDVRLSSVSDQVPTVLGHFSTLTKYGDEYWGMLVPVGDGKYRFTFGREGVATPDETQTALTSLYGEETRLAEVLNSSEFGDATRQLESYRYGRIFFAGDAAHIHPPFGGQGLNLGVQDAFNLGWKLAAAVHGAADLLDTYQAERHPPAARVLRHTAAQRVLALPGAGEDIGDLRELVTDLVRLPDANRYLAGMMSGLDAPGRIPDLELVAEDGPTWLSELLHSGRGLLLDFGDRDWPDGWADRVDVVRVKPDGEHEALLIRPDGLVCWSGEGSVVDALTQWFGDTRVSR